MPRASNLQSKFHGGELAPYTQGRMDRPDYRSGMSVCLNALAIEEGAWTRRPGFRRLGYTHAGRPAVLREFHFNVGEPYNIELTNLYMRLWGGSPLGLNSSNLILENESFGVASISTADPAVVTTFGNHGWATADVVMFRAPDGPSPPEAGHILNRQWSIIVTGVTTFTMVDAVTSEPFDGTGFSMPTVGLTVARVYGQATPWTTAELQEIRTVQDHKTVVLFQGNHAPKRLFVDTEPSTCVNAEFTFTTGLLLDGPYFDPFNNAPTATPSAKTGSITVTLSSSAYPFVSTDVGRAMRLFSEPPLWSAATPYVAGDSVRWLDDAYYTALDATTGDDPFSSPTKWIINPKAARWAWGYITAVTDSTHATVALNPDSDLLYTTAMRTWRMGLYSDTTGWPTGGAFHQGRLYIWGNVIPNRVDGTKSNEGLAYDSVGVFSPTNWDGTVADNFAVAAVFQADNTNPILWGVSDDQGLLCGAKSAEFLVRPGATDDAITPTSIRVKRVSKYGSANVEPRRVGDAVIFVDRFDRKLFEYMASGTSGSPRYSASNLTLKGKHLSAPGISELAYQHELVPILWARTALNDLIGLTYKKDGQYNGLPEDIQAWHDHDHGATRKFWAISGGPTGAGLDTLMAVTYDPTDTEPRFQVEQLQLLMGQNANPESWNGLDASVVPVAAEIGGTAPNEYVRYYGLDHLEGETVTAWIAGFDCGEFTVTNGVVDVPLDATSGVLTRAQLAAVTTGSSYNGLAITFSAGTSTLVPAAPDTTGITQMIPGGEALAQPGSDFVVDYVNDKVYVVTNGHGVNAGFRRYNATTGALEASVDTPTLFGIDSSSWSVSLGNVDVNGNLYMIADSGNFDAVFKVHGPTLTHVSSLAAPPTYTGAIVNGSEFVPVTIGGRTLVTQVGYFVGAGSAAYVNLIDADAVPMATVGTARSLTGTEKAGLLARGRVLSDGCGGSGSVFVVGFNYSLGSDATPLSFYELRLAVDNAGNVTHNFRTVGTLTPSQVHASWTAWAGAQGIKSINVDQVDGNILILTQNSLGAFALTKLDATNASVIWTLLNHNPNLAGSRNSYINGNLAYKSDVGVSGVYPVYNINTLTGLVTATGTATDVTGATRWDGSTGRLYGRGDYTQVHVGFPVGHNTSGFTDDYYRFDGSAGSGSLTDYKAPAVFGSIPTARGQVLRPIMDAGAANGPAMGKTRRVDQYTLLLQRCGPMSVGTDFVSMRPVDFQEPDGTYYATGRLFSGLVWNTIEGDYNFDGQPAWEVTRPGPATVLAVESFLTTQDR